MLYVIKLSTFQVYFDSQLEVVEIIAVMNSGSSHARHSLLNYKCLQFVNMPENKPKVTRCLLVSYYYERESNKQKTIVCIYTCNNVHHMSINWI
jgi:hypothetical protein